MSGPIRRILRERPHLFEPEKRPGEDYVVENVFLLNASFSTEKGYQGGDLQFYWIIFQVAQVAKPPKTVEKWPKQESQPVRGIDVGTKENFLMVRETFDLRINGGVVELEFMSPKTCRYNSATQRLEVS